MESHLTSQSPPKRPKRSRVLDEPSALRYCLGLLKSRPRTSFEVAVRLKEKGYEDTVINSTIGQLLEVRLLDDERFARDWVRYRDRLRPSGEWLIKHELEEKGLDERIISRALAARQTPEWFDEIGLRWDGRPIDRHLCEQVAAKRIRRLGDIDEQKKKQRVAALLARRGFKPSDVFGSLKITAEE